MDIAEQPRTQQAGGDMGGVGDSRGEPRGRRSALAGLQARLADGLATSGLDVTQLARRTELGRTTVSNALNQPRVPSAKTVAAMAGVLGLDQKQLLELRRQAAAERDEPNDPRSPEREGIAGPPDPAVEDGALPEAAPALHGRTGPVTLPPLTKEFTGRDGELRDLLHRLEPVASGCEPAEIRGGTAAPATVVVSAVAGMAGVGKTALALQAAHQARLHGWFPGGILFANLYGYSHGWFPGGTMSASR
ncbi:hypothetical protein E2C00_32960 [Streptomyces sp. WAC05374]|uniref:helix-turn-helix domain-containing protein n=1 Tax=Streptomyces sp. WAC05374 TaxID=2487420 RepID=UPI000F890DFD|nr:helix-turn-helix transcriptional regulator [Streptomyces sp. WAC05374]RST17454.1 hypothetical protein EF905_09570 [Streptomyces sp. WAC05374]TDF36820.1 hypothetical protein E2B92_30610 [Streptomyces sp. WAC05374]TDF46304.1 hypothetical protein E2C02_32340 [Streptomyces sp. WAC05374]TDF46873.1 hypothetical protein E2C00_32960 [Streptomyces sp. WAC05374]